MCFSTVTCLYELVYFHPLFVYGYARIVAIPTNIYHCHILKGVEIATQSESGDPCISYSKRPCLKIPIYVYKKFNEPYMKSRLVGED